MESVAYVRNFVLVDALQNRCAFGVSSLPEDVAVVVRVVQVGLFEGQAEAGDIVDRGFHARNRVPEKTTERELAELHSAVLHSCQIPSGVPLLFPQRVGKPDPEFVRCIRKTQQREGH